MNEEMNGQVERRTAQGVVSASSTRSSASKETVAKKKQQWHGGPRRYHPTGQYSDNQGYPNVRGRYDNRNFQQYKRPIPRGGYNQNFTSRNNNTGEVDMKEDRTPTSKKMANSLNYLLNFKYSSRERGYEQRTRSNSKKYNSFNKEKFLQANCQFIVNDSADYTVYSVEPDILVDWSLIEQVRIFSHEVPSCPICLYSPKAAKITRCGHVYCWSCILHYLSLSEKSWRKCPICYESVTKKDLKSVMAMESYHFAKGQTITMRLMKKMKNTTFALPKSQWEEREMKPFTINDSIDTCYCKLLLASHDDVLKQIIETEETALNVQLTEAKLEESSEICFIESALSELKARKDGLQGEQNAVKQVSKSLERISISSDEASVENKPEGASNRWNVYRKDSSQDSEEFEPAFSDEEDNTEVEQTSPAVCIDSTVQGFVAASLDSKATETPPDNQDCQAASHVFKEQIAYPALSDKDSCDSPTEMQCNLEMISQEMKTSSGSDGITGGLMTNQSSVNQDHMYTYFYQAEDGQNIFLHPINARCLIQEYGSLENCPEYISAKILEMEAMSQTEESRKRYRYLRHLPLTCEFVICEVDLKPPVVSNRTLDHFRVEIQKRKQCRQKKMKVEKRRELKVDAKVASIEGRTVNSGRQSTAPLNLNSDVDFPTQCQPSAMAMSPLGHKPGPFTQLVAASTAYNDEDVRSSSDEPTGQQASISPPSFAQALRAGKAAELSKPTVKRQQKDEVQVTTRDPLDDESDEDYIPPPTYQNAFLDAFSAAVGESLENQLKADVAMDISGGKRKKKNKKKLLFSTGHMKFH